MNKEIREPKQQRAIQKKEEIIKAAYKVFSDVGYYNTNTADIAKKASVSTGIVYDYFKDKKDIFFYVIKIYINDVKAPIMEFINSIKCPLDYEKLANDMLDLTISIHKSNANLHNVLHSFADTHDDINEEFIALENEITHLGAQKLNDLDSNSTNSTEKVHFIMDVVQSFAHELLYDRHDYINYDAMKQFVINSIVNTLKA